MNVQFVLDLPADPLAMLAEWYDAAKQTEPMQPNAASLATVRPDGRPNARMMFIREIKDGALRFNAGIESPKGTELAAQPYAVLTLHWKSQNRQVRIGGYAELIEDSLADAEFVKRPLLHKLGVWASEESQPLSGAEELQRRLDDYHARFGEDVPRPAKWTGYRLRPLELQFWAALPHQLHERIGCERADVSSPWTITRLNP